MQIETIVRYHFSAIRFAKLKKKRSRLWGTGTLVMVGEQIDTVFLEENLVISNNPNSNALP